MGEIAIFKLLSVSDGKSGVVADRKKGARDMAAYKT